MANRVNNLTGQRFGRLIVIKESGRAKSRSVIWLCKCDCGNYHKVESRILTSGHTLSCGCLSRDKFVERLTKHNMSKTRLYKCWQDMKTRCSNPNTPYYHSYGGRGISYCKEWNTFESFKEWALANGYIESANHGECTLDRIDVNKNYCPENCRWITNQEQQNNRRNNILLTFNGETKTLTQWANDINIKSSTLSARIKDYHWSVEKALTTPVKERKRKGNV